MGLRKCAVAHVKQGKYVSGENYLLPEERTIERVLQGGAYKYLGIEQLFTADHTSIRVSLQQVYVKWLFKIWSSSLSAKHKVHATNNWAVAVFQYFFPLVKWPHNALVQLNRLTRRILRRFKSHHHSTTIEWLYLSRMNGGRGMVNLYQAWEREVVASELYLVNAIEDEPLQTVVKLQLFLASTGKYSNLQTACNILRRYGVHTDLQERVWSGELLP